jgi:hypothetical protein
MPTHRADKSVPVATRQYIPPAAAAEVLGLSEKTLSRWRWAGKGPPYRKFGSSVRYAFEDLEAYAANSAVQPGRGLGGNTDRESRHVA